MVEELKTYPCSSDSDDEVESSKYPYLSLFLLIAPNGQASKKLTLRLPSQRKGGQITLFAERGMIII